MATAAKKKITGINESFGIRKSGDRSAVLHAFYRNLGKPQTAAKLAQLVRGKKTSRVALIVTRIETKAAKYKLPFKMITEKKETGRVYTMRRK